MNLPYCECCGFQLEEWELEYSSTFCTICPGLPEFQMVMAEA